MGKAWFVKKDIVLMFLEKDTLIFRSPEKKNCIILIYFKIDRIYLN